MFDSHAHLCYPDFNKDREKAISKAREAIAGVMVSSARYDEGLCVLQLVKRHPGFLFASLGYHPTEGTELEKTIRLIKSNPNAINAIGEVGLDYHHQKNPAMREKQKETFQEFIDLARSLGKPLVIHSWDAEQDAFDMVKNAQVRAVFHSFTGPKDLALEIAEHGFLVTVSTMVLFSKSIRKIAKALPLASLLLETDAPFLDPDRKRKRNTPENVLLSAKKIAELRKIPVEEVNNAALENAKRVFNLPANL
jgi:TatD DNase family protein